MFSLFLLVIPSLLGFLSNFQVSCCDQYCSKRTTFNPPHLVVKYADPFFVTCDLCQSCSSDNFNLEKSLGTIEINGTQIEWTVPKTTVWTMHPLCYYVSVENQCCTKLPVTVYNPPDAVSIQFMDHSNVGPLYTDQQYIMECAVTNVAPIQNVVVTFFRGPIELGQARSRKRNSKPTDEVFKLPINISAEDNGVQFWCQAKLELGPHGPQHPPIRTSENYTAEVFYKPVILGPSSDTITLTQGDPLLLNCSAVGNPSPKYTWTVPEAIADATTTNDSIFSIQSVAYEHDGRYTCTATSKAGGDKVDYHVVVKANIVPYVVIAVFVAIIVVIIIAVMGYSLWHKVKREKEYSLIGELCCQRKHDLVPNAESPSL